MGHQQVGLVVTLPEGKKFTTAYEFVHDDNII